MCNNNHKVRLWGEGSWHTLKNNNNNFKCQLFLSFRVNSRHSLNPVRLASCLNTHISDPAIKGKVRLSKYVSMSRCWVSTSQQIRLNEPMLASVCDAKPTSTQHWLDECSRLGFRPGVGHHLPASLSGLLSATSSVQQEFNPLNTKHFSLTSITDALPGLYIHTITKNSAQISYKLDRVLSLWLICSMIE